MQRSDAVDWLKAGGITLIVYGHVAHASTVAWVPPIYVKQLGVAAFLFATGFTLAREQRSALEVLFNRLFPIYLFGLGLAGALTLAGIVFGGGLALSNYLPLAGGAHVLFDNFPANPTTWYLGTYLHFLVIWAIALRQLRINPSILVAAAVAEVAIRMALITWAGPYVAYMLFTNWIVVFLLGLQYGARRDQRLERRTLPFAAALALSLIVWAQVFGSLAVVPAFPFMQLDGWSPLSGGLLVSAATTVMYGSVIVLAWQAARALPAPAPVRFAGRHSLIVVLGHMPLFLTLNPVLAAAGFGYWSRVVVHLVIGLFGLTLVSAVLTRLVQPKRLGKYCFELICAIARSDRGAMTVVRLEGQ